MDVMLSNIKILSDFCRSPTENYTNQAFTVGMGFSINFVDQYWYR